MSTLYPGDLLDGRYRIATAIAQGGMSTVYAAIDTRLDREVAVKVMDSALAHDTTFRTRFEREARAVARLSHPSLVNVFDQGVDTTLIEERRGAHSAENSDDSAEELVFLVMELVQGGSLRELLRERGPMPPHAVVAVMKPVLTALAVAHSTGMIHRDLKPDNVLIGEDHDVKLADFGLVRAIGTSTDTSHGQVIGTAAYLSPEQVQGKHLTQASDVYSAGVLMFELMTGTTPFNGTNPIDTATARLHNDVPLPSTLAEGIPQEFDDIVATACHQDPEQRYVDGQEFLEDLLEVAEELEIPPFKVPVPRHSRVAEALSRADFGERKSWDDASMATRTLTIPSEDQEPDSDDAQDPPAGDPYERYETRQWVAPTPQQDTAAAPAASPAPLAQPHQPVPAQAPVPPSPRPANAPASRPLTNRSTARTVVWLLVVIALVVSMALGAWWLTSGRYGEVPSVLGMDRVAATSSLEQEGFHTTVTEQYSDDVPLGAVIKTEPPFGHRVLQGSDVVMLVSLGQPIVPELNEEETAASYISRLNRLTLNGATGDDEYSDSVPSGSIVRVEPSPGTAVKTQSSVTVHVSKGPQPIEVPDVAGESESSASAAIQDAGLKVDKVKEEEGGSVEPGHVIRTDPPAGTRLSKGDKVTVYVSGEATVPFVLGMTGEYAKKKLKEQGFKVDIDGKKSGIVYSQSPGPMSKTSKGATVTIKTL
ncbi:MULTISPECIES: Stk1 family PASTA domain-containing Ser/Thr kinase [Corynebacterium]|uniref:Stk1 family PASTA domain-containing Ser/Thr kinase n=1 Tax=Corynebacterium TaxID=1716 RepID=UPI001CE3D35A|nr:MULTISPECIES: Stk1 family PASTA domain-containing Ser/Thr kinase [Corynebacterium]